MLLMAVWALHFIYPVFYSVSVLEIYNEQRETIEEKGQAAFEKLCLDQAAFRVSYNPQSKELNINGDFYDVASFEKKGDIINCYVLKDKEETDLNKSICSELQHEQSAKNTKFAWCWWPVASLYTSYPGTIPFFGSQHKAFPSVYDIPLHKGYIFGIIQPPRRA